MAQHPFSPSSSRPSTARRRLARALAVLCLAVLAPASLSAQLQIADELAIEPPDLDSTTYTALWRPTGTVEVRKAASDAAFDAHRQELSNWRLVDFEHRFGKWAGLWRPTGDAGELDRLLLDLTPANLDANQTTQRTDGFELVDLEVERRAGIVRVDGLFHPNAPLHVAHFDLDFPELSSLSAMLAGDGLHLVDIETYLDPGGSRRWAGLWRQEALDTVAELAAPGSLEAGTLKTADRHPIDFEAYYENSGWLIAGVWRTGLSDEDWFRGIAPWSEIVDRDDALTPNPGDIVASPPKVLVDIDITSSFGGAGVRPMPLDHDGPVGPGGP